MSDSDYEIELNKRVAKALGWYVKRTQGGQAWPRRFDLYMPDGVYVPSSDFSLDEESAWRYLPRFAYDLNAAWELYGDLRQPEYSSDPHEQARLICEQWLRENEARTD